MKERPTLAFIRSAVMVSPIAWRKTAIPYPILVYPSVQLDSDTTHTLHRAKLSQRIHIRAFPENRGGDRIRNLE
jgi:hypothetical protein